MCYGDVINKAKKFKSDTSKLVKSLKNLIHKGYDLSTIVYSLNHVYSACTTIGPNRNYSSTFIFHYRSNLKLIVLIGLLAGVIYSRLFKNTIQGLERTIGPICLLRSALFHSI